MRFSAAAAVAITAWGAAHSSAPAVDTAVKPHIVLVELFTSEGCSDCPPADQLLRQIDGKRDGPDTLVVGLSEHVTYWDHIGWKDPFSTDVSTQRQEDYGRRFGLDSVYTPQMVVNGESQMVGGNADAVRQGIAKAQAASDMALHIGDLKLAGDAVQATATVMGSLPARGAVLYAAIAEDETTAKVLAGENRGRTLAHTSVARELVKVASIKTTGDSQVSIKLPPADAGMRRHLVVWMQEPGLGRVLGVDSKDF